MIYSSHQLRLSTALGNGIYLEQRDSDRVNSMFSYCILHPRLESVQQTGGHSIYYFFVQVIGRFSLQTLSPFPSLIRMHT